MLGPGIRIGLVHAGNLGDVVAALPMAGAIKAACPSAHISFICRCYSAPVAMASQHVDAVLDADQARDDSTILAEARLDVLLNPFPYIDIARSAARVGVPVRVGNLRRGARVRWCNRFVFYGRSRSGLHEAALNLRDLRSLGLRLSPSIGEMARLAGITRIEPLAAEHRSLLAPDRFHLIVHPKTNANAREWPLGHFLTLARMLSSERVQLILTGTAADREIVRAACPELWGQANVTDAFGRFGLSQLMAFIAAADGLVAASTGPLHLAAVLGIHALGIYSGHAGMTAWRWFPLGPKGEAVQSRGSCPGDTHCKRLLDGGPCSCTIAVTPQTVYERVTAWL